MNEFRQSPEGVVAVRDVRMYGGSSRPWAVVWIPPGHHSHWPSMPLHDQDVALWAVLRTDTREEGKQQPSRDMTAADTWGRPTSENDRDGGQPGNAEPKPGRGPTTPTEPLLPTNNAGAIA